MVEGGLPSLSGPSAPWMEEAQVRPPLCFLLDLSPVCVGLSGKSQENLCASTHPTCKGFKGVRCFFFIPTDIHSLT